MPCLYGRHLGGRWAVVPPARSSPRQWSAGQHSQEPHQRHSNDLTEKGAAAHW